MSSHELSSTDPLTEQYLTELATTARIKGYPYSNIQLVSPAVGIGDQYDPNMSLQDEFATLLWPGGSPTYNAVVESVTFHDEPDPADIQFLRNAVLGAAVSKAALKRVPSDIRNHWNSVPEVALENLLGYYAFSQLPAGIISVRRVNESTSIPVGTRLMSLHHATAVHPKDILASMQRALEGVIAEEQI